ncbi:hypothetical protein D9M68_654820 [compost metagenome]
MDDLARRHGDQLGATGARVGRVTAVHPVLDPLSGTIKLDPGDDLAGTALLVPGVGHLVGLDQLELERHRLAALQTEMMDPDKHLARLFAGANGQRHQAIDVQHAVIVRSRPELVFPELVGRLREGTIWSLGARFDPGTDLVADPVGDAVGDPAIVSRGIPRPGAHAGELAGHGAGWAGGARRPLLQTRPGAGRVVVRLGLQRGSVDHEASLSEGVEIHRCTSPG